MKSHYPILLLFSVLFIGLQACISNPNEITVTLEIASETPIESIVFFCGEREYHLEKSEFEDKNKVNMTCDLSGEGTFAICITTNSQKFCTEEHYVESGYKPEVLFDGEQFELKEPF